MKIYNPADRAKWITAAVALVVLVFAVYSYKLYQWGVSSAETAAAAAYSENEKAFAEKQKVLEDEKQAANRRADEAIIASLKTKKENNLLRQAAEINAHLMRESDDRRRSESAAKLNQIIEEKKNDIKKIQSDTDYGSNVCAVCDELAGAGFKLSSEFCSACRRK